MHRHCVLRNPGATWATALLMLALAGCATPSSVGGADDGGPQTGSRIHTVILVRGQEAVVAAESLTLKLTEISDSRCPAAVTCVWAGHAAATLQASKPGQAPATLVIGSQAPAAMGLPYEASYAGLRFHLLALEPAGTVPAPRATIRISRP
ncbi:MAG: hypothetical protein EOP91_05600 [Lysobacteraceae bacterium]|nr:MAG: hypothetical protein EOP91_05600 [Xanthomonadaceae bacterium]